MTTFVEQYGHVRYPLRGYKAQGPCEVPGCAQQLQQLIELNRRRVMIEIARSAASPTPDIDALIAELQNHSLTLMVTNQGRYRYEVDHCHEHEWIRGVVCRSCNGVLSYRENALGNRPYVRELDEFVAMDYGITLVQPDYDRYRMNCPECKSTQVDNQDTAITATVATRPAITIISPATTFTAPPARFTPLPTSPRPATSK